MGGIILKKHYKNLNFNSKEDYLVASYSLIGEINDSLKRYIRYGNNLENFITKLSEEEVHYVSTEEFHEWKDKLQNVSHELIMFFVDEVKTGFSYIKFRKLIERTEYHLDELQQDIKDDLKELGEVRNWSFHNPQSKYVAQIELIAKEMPWVLRQKNVYQFNPIKVGYTEKTSISCLFSLSIHVGKRTQVFLRLLKAFMHDFETLLGEEVHIEWVNEGVNELLNYSTRVAQLSMAMQKRKYDGSDEQFQNITFSCFDKKL